MTQEAQLKACPFCGCEASREFFTSKPLPTWSLFCDGCHASTAALPNIAEAIAAWNTRTPDSVIAELGKAAQGLKADLLERAEWDGDVRVVCAGAGAWARFCNALAKLEASK